jgi:hypothetical protein
VHAPVPFADLADVSPEDAFGMLRELGDQALAKRADESVTEWIAWKRQYHLRQAARDALALLAEGRRPKAPAATPPRWLETVVRDEVETLAARWSHGPAFWSIRSLERLGAVGLEADREYVLAFVSGWVAGTDIDAAAAALRSDPELRERAFWPMFRTEGGREVSLRNVDKFMRESPWRSVVVRLVDDGTVDRDRVVVACLDALVSDLGAYQAGWFSGALLALALTPAQLARHQDRLVAVLRSMVPASVTFAVDRLREIDRAGLLDDVGLAEGIDPALTTRGKTTATHAIRLLDAVASRRPELVPTIARSALRALEHPDAGVQARALDLLETLGSLDLAQGVLVHPTLAGRLATHPEAVDVQVGSVAEPLVGSAPMTSWSAPTLRLPPAATPGDVVERVAGLLEGEADPLELESVLTALAEVTDPSFLSPLAKRALAVRRRAGETWPTPPLSGAIASLVLFASGLPAPAPGGDGPRHPAATEFLRRRLAEVGGSLLGRAPATPLLATPTDGPWIAPEVLVERLVTARSDGRALRHADTVAALLRLHPDGRAPALDLWTRAARSDVLQPIVAHALGAPPPEGGEGPWTVRRDSDLWVAASRARSPFDTDPLLVAAGLADAEDAQPIAADVDVRQQSSHGSSWPCYRVVVNGGASPAEPESLADWPRWLATTFPHDAEHFLVGSMAPVLWSTYTTPANTPEAGHVLDSLLTHPGRTGRLSAVTVAAGLAAVGHVDRVRAADCFAALVVTGRITVEELADAMRTLAPFVPVQRWAASLGDASEAAPGARDAVVELLVALLPRLDRSRRGIVNLLDRLAEEVALLGAFRVGDPAFVAWASGFAGTSRAAKAARALAGS